MRHGIGIATDSFSLDLDIERTVDEFGLVAYLAGGNSRSDPRQIAGAGAVAASVNGTMQPFTFTIFVPPSREEDLAMLV